MVKRQDRRSEGYFFADGTVNSSSAGRDVHGGYRHSGSQRRIAENVPRFDGIVRLNHWRRIRLESSKFYGQPIGTNPGPNIFDSVRYRALS